MANVDCDVDCGIPIKRNFSRRPDPLEAFTFTSVMREAASAPDMKQHVSSSSIYPILFHVHGVIR